MHISFVSKFLIPSLRSELLNKHILEYLKNAQTATQIWIVLSVKIVEVRDSSTVPQSVIFSNVVSTQIIVC